MKSITINSADNIEKNMLQKQKLFDALRKIIENPINHGEIQLRLLFRDGKIQRYVTLIEESHWIES